MRQPYPPEQWSLGRLLSTAARMVEHDWNAWLADHELTHAGLLALHALQSGPLTQRELATASRVEEQTMSRVLERLERNGHITRQRDRKDRRRLIIQCTKAGARIWAEASCADVAERLVADRVGDPDKFRAELIRLVEQPAANTDRPTRACFPNI